LLTDSAASPRVFLLHLHDDLSLLALLLLRSRLFAAARSLLNLLEVLRRHIAMLRDVFMLGGDELLQAAPLLRVRSGSVTLQPPAHILLHAADDLRALLRGELAEDAARLLLRLLPLAVPAREHRHLLLHRRPHHLNRLQPRLVLRRVEQLVLLHCLLDEGGVLRMRQQPRLHHIAQQFRGRRLAAFRVQVEGAGVLHLRAVLDLHDEVSPR